MIDHRGPEFAALTETVRWGCDGSSGPRTACRCSTRLGHRRHRGCPGQYPRPRRRVLVFNYGVFSGSLAMIARKFGFDVDEVVLGYGKTLTPAQLEQKLRADSGPTLIVPS